MLVTIYATAKTNSLLTALRMKYNLENQFLPLPFDHLVQMKEQ